MKNLKKELIEILTYFNDGLKDIESGSGEEQPLQKRTEATLKKVKKLITPDVSELSEQLVNFLIYLNDKNLINNHDFDYEKETKKYLMKGFNKKQKNKYKFEK